MTIMNRQMKYSFFILLLVGFVSTNTGNGKKFLELPALFSDNMVLQQQFGVSFWGKATPGLQVSVKGSWGNSGNTSVKDDSTWILKLKTPKAGGPFTVSLQVGDSTITYKNVLVGEVWICSGQSNMEMPLAGWPPNDTIGYSAQEIKNATYADLRLFTVTRAYSDKPEANCLGTWIECTPQAASKFSATAFFFGKKLDQELKIPIGLIHSSWGGTAVEAWIGKKSLSTIDKFQDILKKIQESRPAIKQIDQWLKSHPVIDVSTKDPQNKWKEIDAKDSDCSKPGFDDSKWRTMILPTQWEITEVGDFDGLIWFRKKIEIPRTWLNKDLVLELGPVDDMDITYVNGQKVGSYEEDGFWQTDRIYTVPAALVKDSVVNIAVRVLDDQGAGGIWGKKEKMNLHPKESDEKIQLAGEWKYFPVAQYIANKFYLFDIKGDEYYNRPKLPVSISAATPTALYNGMIAPLVQYAIKGAIWYQGESNVGEAELYKTLFPMMIKNWRDEWKEGDFPFYYVQIAPWQYGPESFSQKLREAQFLSLSAPKTGMAVTLDIGSPKTIHPPDKKDVGERLALWALAKDYHKKIPYSGPIYKKMKVYQDKVVFSFDHSDGGLVLTLKDGMNNFLIAGEDKIFKKADAMIAGGKLVVYSREVKKPVAVRYGWTNYVDASLFNKAGLPASSFRTDDWEN